MSLFTERILHGGKEFYLRVARLTSKVAEHTSEAAEHTRKQPNTRVTLPNTRVNLPNTRVKLPNTRLEQVIQCSCQSKIKYIPPSNLYYIDESALLGSKLLAESVPHYIRDSSDVSPICHSHECHISSRSGLDLAQTLSCIFTFITSPYLAYLVKQGQRSLYRILY